MEGREATVKLYRTHIVPERSYSSPYGVTHLGVDIHSRSPQLMAVSTKYAAPSLFSGGLELRRGLTREDSLQGRAVSASGADRRMGGYVLLALEYLPQAIHHLS